MSIIVGAGPYISQTLGFTEPSEKKKFTDEGKTEIIDH